MRASNIASSIMFALPRAVLLAAALWSHALVGSLRAQGTVSLDANFTPSTSFVVSCVAVQADGKLMLGGAFTKVNGVDHFGIARLLPDGTLDNGFNAVANTADLFPGISKEGIYSLVIQPDGRIVVGGDFTQVNGVARPGIARLNADGTLDATFNPVPNGTYTQVLALAGDGSILLGGDFTQVNSHAHARVARLRGDGSPDEGFNTAANGYVTSAVLQPNGKILLGGNFTQVNGLTHNRVARIYADGSVDAEFAGSVSYPVGSLAVQADGNLLIGIVNNRYVIEGTAHYGILRLDPSGNLDTTFNANTNNDVNNVSVQPDGKIVLAGLFSKVNGENHSGLARLNADGTLDNGFTFDANAAVNDVARQADGNLLLGGEFGKINGVVHTCLARLAVRPAFYDGEAALSGGVFFLRFPTGNPFGYYSYLSDQRFIYHFDLGYEYWIDANDGTGGIYLYDYASDTFFYTSPAFAFPYLYDFTLNTILYYYPDPNIPDHYNTDGHRFFYRFDNGQIITK